MYSNIEIQPYTVVKISIHEKWKHTSINKLFLYLFVCEFLLLYYCNFNEEIVLLTYEITIKLLLTLIYLFIYTLGITYIILYHVNMKLIDIF